MPGRRFRASVSTDWFLCRLLRREGAGGWHRSCQYTGKARVGDVALFSSYVNDDLLRRDEGSRRIDLLLGDKAGQDLGSMGAVC